MKSLKSLNVEERRKHYRHNVKLLSQVLLKDKIKYHITTAELAKLLHCSTKSVTSFLQGKTVPDHIFVTAITNAIVYLKKRKKGNKL